MNLTPNIIYEHFERNAITKTIAFEQLISFLENSDNEKIRIEALLILDKIGVYNDRLFVFLENLFLSDSNGKIRNLVANFICKRFIDKAITPLKWKIKHESNYDCLITIIKTLEKINNQESKLTLYSEVKKILKEKYICKDRRIKNTRFKKVIKNLIKIKTLEKFTIRELSEILINFFTIKQLTTLFPNTFFELDPQSGLVKELDLSDYLEFEVKGTPWGWKNDIKFLSELIGLEHLQNLKKLDLSNNQIGDLKKIIKLKNLTHVCLANNKICELENLKYLKKLPNLMYLDLRDNDIVLKISINEFNSKIRVLLQDYLILK